MDDHTASSTNEAVLTCWKDIARYFGKGVRTVQRWEQIYGLPVRRPNGAKYKSAVIAHTTDLRAWQESSWGDRVAKPLNSRLRSYAVITTSSRLKPQQLWQLSSPGVPNSNQLVPAWNQLESPRRPVAGENECRSYDSPLDLKAQFDRVRTEAQQTRANAIRSRILITQTFCAIAETEVRMSPEQARHSLATIRRSIDEIERHISEPNHISRASANEFSQLLLPLKARVVRIEHSL